MNITRSGRTTDVTTTIQDRVQAGMTLLDQRLPGWEDHIDLDRLDMRLFGSCILGQLYGSEVATENLGLQITDSYQTNQVVQHGFGSGEHSYDDLTQAWREAIKVRRLVPA